MKQNIREKEKDLNLQEDGCGEEFQLPSKPE